MALRQAAQSLRAAVLSRVAISALPQQQTAAPLGLAAWKVLARRGLADASYLDKAEVTDRVLGVVKGFDKVDASKVRGRVRSGDGKAGRSGLATGKLRRGRRRSADGQPGGTGCSVAPLAALLPCSVTRHKRCSC